MKSPVVRIDTRRIHDWASLHDLFAELLGFPSFYGRNMDAWIDCLNRLHQPEYGMTSIYPPLGGVLVLQLEHVDDFMKRCPEQYKAIVECTAFVNSNCIELGDEPVVALSFTNDE
jgi:hypothetical protein